MASWSLVAVGGNVIHIHYNILIDIAITMHPDVRLCLTVWKVLHFSCSIPSGNKGKIWADQFITCLVACLSQSTYVDNPRVVNVCHL